MDNELELTNTGVFKAVAPTPDQLHEARLGIPARMDEMDRELLAKEALGRGIQTTCIETAYGTTTRLPFQIKVF